MKERLQKYMAHTGLASRRVCEEMIRAGRVTVNGQRAALGAVVDPAKDIVLVDGKPIGRPERKRYVIVHKPRGYVTTVRDQYARKTVLDLVQGIEERVYPAGRLDYDSEGLVFLTNDGRLANNIMHPSHGLEKVYLVTVEGAIGNDALKQLRRGVLLEDGMTQPAQVELLSQDNQVSVLRMAIREGRNRQVRRMCSAVGFPVKRLVRIAIGPIKLGDLKAGAMRELTPAEVSKLKQAVNISWQRR
ncbi:MAG TPA: rRNA pseudouridine synthase [Firmicutes bacterium]|nr:MAG: hypothetical protein AA931_02600 [Peptococcaceae bacterium 1109]HHT72597.1 rRNA pseudouridine synthase [Bacillota bacterium]